MALKAALSIITREKARRADQEEMQVTSTRHRLAAQVSAASKCRGGGVRHRPSCCGAGGECCLVNKQSLSLGHTERRNLGAEYCRAGQVSSDTSKDRQAEPRPLRCGSAQVSTSVRSTTALMLILCTYFPTDISSAKFSLFRIDYDSSIP